MTGSIDRGREGRQSVTSGGSVGEGGAPAPASSASNKPCASLLTADQAAALLGLSVRSFHELRREPWMVQPVQLGPRLLRWPRAELEAAIARMPRQASPGAEPAQLRRQRIERAKRDGCLLP